MKHNNKKSLTVVYVTEEQDIAKGVQTSNVIREHCPVSFIGIVNPKKVSGVYKKYEGMGGRYAVGIENGQIAVRDLSERNTETFPSIDEALSAITNSNK